MGLTYKENVPDTRELPVRETVKELKGFGIDVYGYDGLLYPAYWTTLFLQFRQNLL